MTTRKKTTATVEIAENHEQPVVVSKTDGTADAKSEDQKIYIGPTIPKTNLFQYTLLSNGIPEDAKKHVEACPIIKKLIVPYTELSQSRVSLEKIGTPENTFFEKIIDYLEGSER